MNKHEYATIAAMRTALWGTPTPAEMMHAAEPLLADIEFKDAERAVLSFQADGAAFAPHFGMIRKRAVELSMPAFPTSEDAWKEIREQVARCGWTRMLPGGRQPVWSNPIIGEIADAIGWQALCESENEVADRAHFTKFYAVKVERAQAEARMPPSVRAMVEAAANGHAIEDVIGQHEIGPGR